MINMIQISENITNSLKIEIQCMNGSGTKYIQINKYSVIFENEYFSPNILYHISNHYPFLFKFYKKLNDNNT